MYKCEDTLVSFGLKVDYTADRYNLLALTDTYCVEARKVYYSAGMLFHWYLKVIYAADTLATFELCFQTADTILRGGKWDLKSAVLRLKYTLKHHPININN